METHSANIERMCLSVCFGFRKFQTYLYGRHVIIQNDHKLLEMIQWKPIHTAPPWLQCMLFHMQKYDYTIQYNLSKEMVLVNHLSHFPYLKESLPIPILQNIQHVQLSTDKLDGIWGVIECNPVYSMVYCLTLRGWHDCLKQVPRITQYVWDARDELSIEASILLKDWVYIPTWTPQLHPCRCPQSTPGDGEDAGTSQTSSLMAGIDADIADYIQRYTICTKYKASLTAQPMLPFDIPNSLWQERSQLTSSTKETKSTHSSAISLAKYPFLYKVISKSAHSLSQKLQELISQYGPPSCIYTNNITPFTSNKFMQFLQWQQINPFSQPPLPQTSLDPKDSLRGRSKP